MSYCQPSEASPMKFRSFSRTMHCSSWTSKQWICFVVKNPNSSLPICARRQTTRTLSG